MAQVFQNLSPINATGAGCGGPTFTPDVGGGDGRYLEIAVTPTSTGVTDILTPEIYIGSVPSSITSETLQGLYPSSFAILKPGTTELTQANLETVFSNANYPLLLTAIAGGGGGGATTSATDTTLNADSDTNGSGSLLFQTRNTTRAEVKNDGDFAVDTSTLYVESTSNRVGIGSILPSFDLSFGGDVDRILGLERHSTVDTAGNDITVQSGGATTGATDKTGGDLFLASGTATGTGSSNVYLQTATAGATGSTDRSATTKMTILGNGNVGIGTTSPTSLLHLSSGAGSTISTLVQATSAAANAKALFQARNDSNIVLSMFMSSSGNIGTGTDQASAGTVETNGPGGLSIGAVNAAGIMRLYTGGATSASERMRITSAGNVGIGTTTPTAVLHLKAGTAAANTAPLKFTAGVNLTTPVEGAVEFDGTNLYYTDSTLARRTLSTTSSSLSSVSSISNSGGNITLSPAVGTGTVVIDSGTASTGSTNGAFTVNGGAGISGDIYTGGSINAGTTLLVGTNGYIPQLYGRTTSAGNILIDGTSHATKGYVLLNSAGGNVGVNNATPTAALHTVGQAVGVPAASGTTTTGLINRLQGASNNGVLDIGSNGSGGSWLQATNLTNLATNYPLIFNPNGGSVAIGTNTPTSLLHTQGSGAKTASYTGILHSVLNTSSTASINKVGMDIQSTGVWNGASSVNTGLNVNATGGTTNYAATFSGGNVGIGTTTPSALLHLNSSLPAIMMEYPTNLYGQHTFRSNSIERWAFGANGPACNGVSCSSTDEENGFWVFQANNKAGASVASYRLFINDSGDVGIGTTSPSSKLTVAGAMVSTTSAIASGVAVDLASSNTFTLASVGGTPGSAVTIALTNPANGGNYTLVITDTVAHTYDFTGCTAKFWKPVSAATTSGTRSIFTVTTINTSGANYDCYITWATGYQ